MSAVARREGALATGRRITEESPSAAAESFAVVIPALNEAACIGAAVARVRRAPGVEDVVVVDGGSEDGTAALARRAGARVLASAPGRGVQMNAGARAARGSTLVFLHADCELPPAAFESMRAVLQRGHDAGVFAIDYGSPHPLLRLLSALSRLRTRWTEFGEAALFVRRERFESIGGFPNWPLFEDVEILARLRRRGRLGRARGSVRASPRRYLRRGVVRQQLLVLHLYALYHLGVSPSNLQRRYGCAQEAGRNPRALEGAGV